MFHDVRVQGVQDKSKLLYSESCRDVTLITEHNKWKLKRQLGSYEYYEPRNVKLQLRGYSL